MIAYAYTFRRIKPYSRGVFQGRDYVVYTIQNGVITENRQINAMLRANKMYGRHTRETRMTEEYRDRKRCQYRLSYDSQQRRLAYERYKRRQQQQKKDSRLMNKRLSLITSQEEPNLCTNELEEVDFSILFGDQDNVCYTTS